MKENARADSVVVLNGESLGIEELVKISERRSRVEVAPVARSKVEAARSYIEERIKSGEVMYGINTGFGAFSSVRIEASELAQLQINLIRSHCAGVGAPLSREVVRAVLCLRINTLLRGNSGVRWEVIAQLMKFLELDLCPWVPEQGSVGASGDLAPLSHIALALIGEGHLLGVKGEKIPVAQELQRVGLSPLQLQAKEGLSLINGCQVMTAIGLLALHRGENLVRLANLAGALSLEALRGSRSPFHPRISAVRAHRGDAETARQLREWLGESSGISESHADCDRVQDAYSLRCIPAVHGAAMDAFTFAKSQLLIEANSSTDNPLVFADLGLVTSCGNFHGAPVAMALDFSAIAATTLASICERRIEKLINPAMSGGQPAFLTKAGGLNSGLMMVHVAAASLVSESKILSHPASVDSIPTSADKEDHVSMGTIAARKLAKVIDHLEAVVAMELFSASQGLHLLEPLSTTPALVKALSAIRKVAPVFDQDRVFADDIERLRERLREPSFLEAMKV